MSASYTNFKAHSHIADISCWFTSADKSASFECSTSIKVNQHAGSFNMFDIASADEAEQGHVITSAGKS